jgi:hypothetical protein
MIKEAVEAYYLDKWGAPARKAEFGRGGRSVEVYKWDAAATSEGVTVYTTVGASQYPMKKCRQTIGSSTSSGSTRDGMGSQAPSLPWLSTPSRRMSLLATATRFQREGRCGRLRDECFPGPPAADGNCPSASSAGRHPR